ncbi:MAG: DUF4383 domain-containing protein [Chloroflexi bacterium]|nr:DUF4383 domain-containing protein [Chloroflexota bacterium]MCL5110435.1 DUF4383 domain-containing protein [Chloroflexota bacterium]
MRFFAAMLGAFLLLIGVLSFFGVVDFGAPTAGLYAGPGQLIGMFQIDGLHNAIHILFGIWGIAAGLASWGAARLYAQLAGLFFGLLFLLGLFFISQNYGIFGSFMMFNPADNFLNLILSGLSLFFGLVPDFRPRYA